ncbi:MAG: acetamidase [Chloroflexi bacterium]|nr:acetamidase [Chloroflexota bacterium]
MTHHYFTPQIYHTTLGSHEPVLRIEHGDTVSTTTVDAAGKDASNEQVTPPGNPQSGPFYIDGAEPGDTLAVTLDHVAPNRRVGFSSGVIAPNVLDFGHVPAFDDDINYLEWGIDSENGTVRALGMDRLNNLILPLNPMVGCFGVAPARGQAISTATSSTHGGNMDYRGFVQGVKVHFPVFVPGALFHIGDGHALQGDGEIVGTGIEISLDVTFSVLVIKGQEIGWPRAENDTHIMTFGNARPLDQAVQHATTEMIRWLHTDYGLDTRTIHVLLGQVVEYDVGNMFDPAYTMVCKVSKKVLADIT